VGKTKRVWEKEWGLGNGVVHDNKMLSRALALIPPSPHIFSTYIFSFLVLGKKKYYFILIIWSNLCISFHQTNKEMHNFSRIIKCKIHIYVAFSLPNPDVSILVGSQHAIWDSLLAFTSLLLIILTVRMWPLARHIYKYFEYYKCTRSVSINVH
jgi:hypothetical protein